ncbi:MAG TPA: hypothetical protein PK916_01705 [Bacteroidota bacterium]|mgnify:CR=1 FL=1|nr:hypothetical protein [Bacteroidota bacterium]
MGSYGSYLKAALLSQINLLLLGGIGMVSLISGNVWPLLLGLGGEAAWLAVAPLTPAYRRLVDRKMERHAAIDAESARDRLIAALPDAVRARCTRFAALADEVRKNYATYNEGSRVFLDRLALRFDEMLEKYARLLTAQQEYDRHLAAASRGEVEQRLRTLDAEVESADEQLREIRLRQRDVLLQRLERLDTAERDRRILAAQIDTLEETMVLLKEQALTMRRPEEMTEQIDRLLGDIGTTESTVSAIESSFAGLFDRELRDAEETRRLSNDSPS